MATYDLDFEPNPFEQSFASKSPTNPTHTINTKVNTEKVDINATAHTNDSSGSSNYSLNKGVGYPAGKNNDMVTLGDTVSNRSSIASMVEQQTLSVHSSNSHSNIGSLSHKDNLGNMAINSINNSSGANISGIGHTSISGVTQGTGSSRSNSNNNNNNNSHSNVKPHHGIGRMVLPPHGTALKPPVILSPSILTPGGSRHLPMPNIKSNSTNGSSNTVGTANNGSNNNDSLSMNAGNGFSMYTPNGAALSSSYFLNFANDNNNNTSNENADILNNSTATTTSTNDNTKNNTNNNNNNSMNNKSLNTGGIDNTFRTGLTPAILYPTQNGTFNSVSVNHGSLDQNIKDANNSNNSNINASVNGNGNKKLFAGQTTGVDSSNQNFSNQPVNGRLHTMMGFPLTNFSSSLPILGNVQGLTTPGYLNVGSTSLHGGNNGTGTTHLGTMSNLVALGTPGNIINNTPPVVSTSDVSMNLNVSNLSENNTTKSKTRGRPVKRGRKSLESTGSKESASKSVKRKKKIMAETNKDDPEDKYLLDSEPSELLTETHSKIASSKPKSTSIEKEKAAPKPTSASFPTDIKSIDEDVELTEDQKVQRRKEFLERNRLAASKFRKRKKEYVKRIERKLSFYKGEYKELTENCVGVMSGLSSNMSGSQLLLLQNESNLLSSLKTAISNRNLDLAYTIVDNLEKLVSNTKYVKRQGVDIMQIEDDEEEKIKREFSS